MAPDIPNFNPRPPRPGNVQNEKRGGRGGKALRRRRPDGTWEEVEEDDQEPDPEVELDGDSFKAQRDGGGLDDFMSDALPWEAEDAEEAAQATDDASVTPQAAEHAKAAEQETEYAKAPEQAPEHAPTDDRPMRAARPPGDGPLPGAGQLAGIGPAPSASVKPGPAPTGDGAPAQRTGASSAWSQIVSADELASRQHTGLASAVPATHAPPATGPGDAAPAPVVGSAGGESQVAPPPPAGENPPADRPAPDPVADQLAGLGEDRPAAAEKPASQASPVSPADQGLPRAPGGLTPLPPPEGRGSGGLTPPPPPDGRGSGGLTPPPAPGGRGTGGLTPPAPGGRGTGSLTRPGSGQLPPRRTTGNLPPLDQVKGPSPYLQGSWEYKVLDGKTGYPVAAVIELVYLEARVVPVRKQLRTDREGFARGQGLPPGRYQLTLQAQGYHRQTEVRFLRPDAPDRAIYRIQPC